MLDSTTGSDDCSASDSGGGRSEVGACRDMLEAVVILRFLVKGSHTLSRYLAGIDIFRLGRARVSSGTETGSLGRNFSFRRGGCRGTTLMVLCGDGEASPEAACLLGMWNVSWSWPCVLTVNRSIRWTGFGNCNERTNPVLVSSW
jgi:hypothetical protein